MKRNIALRLSYDGARYHGWQSQKNEITIQATLERAVSRVFGEDIHITGCGRTDAGVHALSYCANFYAGKHEDAVQESSGIPVDRIPFAVNALLPPDISVSAAIEVPPDFNAVLSCEKKEYIYKIVNRRIRDPFLAGRAHFYPRKLDLSAMREAAAAFVGTHDFSAVRSVGTETKTTVRTVYWFNVTDDGDLVTLAVCANGFLYNMARAMVGTLLYVSEGKLRADDIPRLLETRDRRLTGPTAPPQGLYLNRLWYPGDAGKLMDSGNN